MADIEVYKRAAERERKARREAEQLLEKKSLELYNTLQALEATAAELHDEVEKTRAVLNAAVEGILTFDADGTIESANPAAAGMFEYDSGVLIGSQLTNLLPTSREASKSEMPDSDWWTSTPGDTKVDSRVAYGKRKSGEIFEMELSASRVQLEERWLYTWLVRDVSNRRTLERRLAVAQRLESVGQLAAGVAHEINTPIQFVGDNLAFMQQAFSKWTDLYAKHEQLHRECQSVEDLAPLCQEITECARDAQLDFLRAELPAAIEQSIEGASRVGEIVRSMKEFSHPGGGAKAPIDLNAAIESTLTVSRNEWKYIADVKTDLDPSIPSLNCYPGDLNQALLNLIVNAAQAISEHKSETQTALPDTLAEPGTIVVSTRRDGEEVVISIADDGPGIPAEIQSRVFDPFFTTKAVGVGTGQGLSIVHQVIVDRHGGKLSMKSTIGQGTTFAIRLPISGKAATESDETADESKKGASANVGTSVIR